MGYSNWWAAVRGKPKEALWAELGLRPTGEAIDFPTRRCPYGWAELPGGWILVAGSWEDRFQEDGPFASLSAGCELVGCFVEEHVMACGAALWKDRVKLWSAQHDAQRGKDHLELWGALPPVLPEIQAAARAREAEDPGGADQQFEVPMELARSTCGFKHDEDTEVQFQELERVGEGSLPQPGKRPWWKRVFG